MYKRGREDVISEIGSYKKTHIEEIKVEFIRHN